MFPDDFLWCVTKVELEGYFISDRHGSTFGQERVKHLAKVMRRDVAVQDPGGPGGLFDDPLNRLFRFPALRRFGLISSIAQAKGIRLNIAVRKKEWLSIGAEC